MAGCGDSGCNCVINAGNGITITGAGTVASPLVVSRDAINLVANDSQTLNLSLSGNGADVPYQLSGAVTARVQDLIDVIDVGGPSNGEGLVWQDDHFVFGLPPVNPGLLNVGLGLLGDGSVGDPVKVNLQSETLGPTSGLRVYVDTAGDLRAETPTATGVAWTAITDKPTTFPPSSHTHVPSEIVNQSLLSVGDSQKVGGHRVFVQSSAPTSGMVVDDLWFY